jgi:hypothetical protein
MLSLFASAHITVKPNIVTGLIPAAGLDEYDEICRHREAAIEARLAGIASLSPQVQTDARASLLGDKWIETQEDSLTKICSNLRAFVQALTDMGPLLDEPIPDEHNEERAARVEYEHS